MCFGVMKNPNKPKIIDDLEPDIFQKVLAFIHAEEKCLKINSMEEAWTLRLVKKYMRKSMSSQCGYFPPSFQICRQPIFDV